MVSANAGNRACDMRAWQSSASGWRCLSVLAVAILAIANGGEAISGIFRGAMWNQTVPDGLRGRLTSIEMFSYSSARSTRQRGVRTDRQPFQRAGLGGLWRRAVRARLRLCAVLLPAFRAYDAQA